jgi:hypothetical protein
MNMRSGKRSRASFNMKIKILETPVFILYITPSVLRVDIIALKHLLYIH